jgi:flagellar biosynthetic protein FlhB
LADDSQKTEQPTGRKLAEARSHGQLVQSREINSLFMLAAGAFIALMLAPSLGGRMEATLARFLEVGSLSDEGGVLWNALLALLGEIVGAFLFPLLLIIGAAFGGSYVQNGLVIAWDRVGFNLGRLSPAGGFTRIFSFNNAIEFIKSTAKFALVMALVGWLALPDLRKIETLIGLDPSALMREIHIMLLHVALGVLLVIAALAVFDYAWQRFSFMKAMRMTRQEVKDENKQTEGDPLIKSRLRQIRVERARRRMMAAMPNASVVVTNPTHYAVALQYEMGAKGAPKVVAKGVDFLAQKIREIAEAHEVPLVENPPLARALYANVELDQEIPPEHYRAVAEIISYVFRLKGKLRARSA